MTINELALLLPVCANAAAVDPSAADVTLAPVARRLFVGVSGDVKVDTAGGQAGVLFKSVPVGYLDVRATKVYKAGTTASGLVAMW
jgi:hypothetical protein